MAGDPYQPRRCRSISPLDPTVQCQGEGSDLTTHIEDHWAKRGDETLRWTHLRMPIANPEPSRLDVTFAEVGEAVLSGARDQQVGGNHYHQFKIQPWDVIDEYDLSFYAGNALKYLLRAGRKGSKLEDLKKARHYLDKMIELEKVELEKEE